MTIELVLGPLLILAPVALVALFLSLALIVLLRPWLDRNALVRPNARSSHQRPTPQGGGAVVVATLVVAWCAVLPAFNEARSGAFAAVTAAAALLALVGAIDDIRTLPAALAIPRAPRRCPAGR